MTAPTPKAFATVLLVSLVLSSFLFFFKLGDRSFRNPDEGRYAEISREMLQSGDWAKPTLYHIDYLRKPPLFYWLIAGSFKAFGYSEWSARAVPALFGILGVLMTAVFAFRFFGLKTALFSSLLLLSNVFYVGAGRYLVIDMVFSFWVVSSLFCYYLAQSGEKHSIFFTRFFYVFCGFSFLAKGVLGFAFPALAIVSYTAITRTWRPMLGVLGSRSGWALLLVLVTPWLFIISSREPEFWNIFFVREHFQRMVADHFEHQEGWYFYPAVFFVAWLPWTLLFSPLRNFFQGMRSSAWKNPLTFLAVSAVTILIFLSFSKSKLPTYILPTFPLAAILLAECWSRWTQETPGVFSRRWMSFSFALLLFAGIGFFVSWPLIVRASNKPFLPSLEMPLSVIAGVLVASSVMALRAFSRNERTKILTIFVGMMMVISTSVVLVLERMNGDYTTRPFARTLKPLLEPNDSVFIYDHPGPFYDFEFYLDHPVQLVGLEGEFEIYSEEDETLHGRYISVKDFDQRLKGSQTLYCIIRASDMEKIDAAVMPQIKIIERNKRKILFQYLPKKGDPS